MLANSTLFGLFNVEYKTNMMKMKFNYELDIYKSGSELMTDWSGLQVSTMKVTHVWLGLSPL